MDFVHGPLERMRVDAVRRQWKKRMGLALKFVTETWSRRVDLKTTRLPVSLENAREAWFSAVEA